MNRSLEVFILFSVTASLRLPALRGCSNQEYFTLHRTHSDTAIQNHNLYDNQEKPRYDFPSQLSFVLTSKFFSHYYNRKSHFGAATRTPHSWYIRWYFEYHQENHPLVLPTPAPQFPSHLTPDFHMGFLSRVDHCVSVTTAAIVTKFAGVASSTATVQREATGG